jgi:hypothetical protein
VFGDRLIIAGGHVYPRCVEVGAVNVYVAAGEALQKKERQDETQVTTKIGGKN